MKTRAPAGSPKFARYAAASAAALGAAAAAQAQFTGSYSLETPAAGTFANPVDLSTFGQWTYDSVQAPGGSVATIMTSSGASLDLTAYSGYTTGSVYFDFYTTAAESGNVTFDYSSTLTGSAGTFRYLVNGSATFITSTNDSGPVSFSVTSGDTFGFRVVAAYAAYTSMQVAITNFSAPAAIPEAGTSTLLAGVASLGFVGLVARRRLRARAAVQASS